MMKVKQMKTIKLKISKRKMKLFLCMEIVLLIAVSILFFLIGKKLSGKNTYSEKEPFSVVESEIVYPSDSYSARAEEKEILLVNRDNRLPQEYEVTLLTLPDGVNRAAKEAYEPLCDMLADGRKEGLAFEICSSYRDVERQQELFDEDVNMLMRQGYTYRDAYEEVAKETMPPGCSEHSTGLAFDIVSLSYQMLDAGQEDTAENKWLQEHCAEYGFILRYPKEKEEITAINYESWHYRYVGVEAAEYIMENGLTLEEYLEL